METIKDYTWICDTYMKSHTSLELKLGHFLQFWVN